MALGSDRKDYRQSTLQLLYQVTVEFVKAVCRNKGFSEASVAEFGGKIFPYGSYRLGVYGPGMPKLRSFQGSFKTIALRCG